jgi:uncharacterized caspase-like protein
MALLRAAIGIVILLSFGGPVSADTPKRVALVIGNAAYRNAGSLANPVRDAKAVAAALRQNGFNEVLEGYNLTKQQFDGLLMRFGDEALGAEWATIYFAGHGISVSGETYVLPVDVLLTRPEHVEDEAVSLARLRAKAGGAKTLRLIVLDSCRNNPFLARMAAAAGSKRAVTRGLARPSEPESGELIVYATRENDVADDGADGHSPFTTAFLQHLPEPGLEVNFLFRKIRSSVLRATNGGQDPAIYASLSDSQLFFVDPAPAQAAVPVAAAVPERVGPNEPSPSLSADAQAWMAVQGSKSDAVLEEYIRRFPDSVYASFARARLEELKRSKAAASKDRSSAAPVDKCAKPPRHCHDCPRMDRAACRAQRRQQAEEAEKKGR